MLATRFYIRRHRQEECFLGRATDQHSVLTPGIIEYIAGLASFSYGHACHAAGQVEVKGAAYSSRADTCRHKSCIATHPTPDLSTCPWPSEYLLDLSKSSTAQLQKTRCIASGERTQRPEAE